MFEQLVSLYYKAIFGYCIYKTNGDIKASEDITQSVFYTLHKKLHKLTLDQNILAWLYRTADNEIKAYKRKNPHWIPLDEIPEEIFSYEEEFPSIAESDLDCLSKNEIELLKAYYGGEDKAEIAKSLNISVSGLYTKIHRIKTKLHDYIVENDEEEE